MRKFIRFLLVSVLVSVVYIPGYCAPEDDYIALRALYLNTDGDNWTNTSNWPNSTYFAANPTMPPGTDFSTWFGIFAVPGGTVEYLLLGSNGLNGQLPLEIGNFTNVEVVELDYNNLSGIIPSTIGNLLNLEYFSASGNMLNGDIPPDIGNMSNLRYLYLSDNQLIGMIPAEIGNLSNIRFLYLDYNQLSGDIPFTIGNASSLTHIELASNQLTGIIPLEIEFLTNLQHLDLSLNQLTGDIPPSIGNLSNLTHLELSDNQLIGNIPPNLAALTNLQFMLLFNNQLTGCYDPALASLCGQLDPTYNNNAGVSDGNMLDANWDDFCASGAGACLLPVAACVARDYEALRALYLSTSGDNWTDRTGWPNAAYFNANPAAAPGTDLSTWYGLTVGMGGCVTELRLQSNNLVGTIPSDIGNMSDLVLIQFELNQLSGMIPPAIGNLNNLIELYLSDNQLTGSIPVEFAALNNLQFMALHTNQLTGCYDPALTTLCNQLDSSTNNNAYVSDGNLLDAPWEDFCTAGIGACNLCPDDLFIGDIPIADGIYQVGSIIISTGEVASGSNVGFKAGGIIALEIGFTVEPQAGFSAEIDGCIP